MKIYMSFDLILQSSLLIIGLIINLLSGFKDVIGFMFLLGIANLLSAFIKIFVYPNKSLFIYLSFVVLFFTATYLIDSYSEIYYSEVFSKLFYVIPFLLSAYYCYGLYTNYKLYTK